MNISEARKSMRIFGGVLRHEYNQYTIAGKTCSVFRGGAEAGAMWLDNLLCGILDIKIDKRINYRVMHVIYINIYTAVICAYARVRACTWYRNTTFY